MRKPRGAWTRALSALFIVWFGVTASQPLPIDLCPMHEAHSGGGTGVSHVSHAAHHGVSPGHNPVPPDQKSAQHCTCPSECGAAGGKAVIANGPLDLPVGRTIAVGPGAWHATAIAPRPIAFLIPFANGPPTSS